MSASDLEAFLARIYTDARARARFRADPDGEAARAGLDRDERAALLRNLDWDGIELYARGLVEKHARHSRPRRP
jgi:hypothetical protein